MIFGNKKDLSANLIIENTPLIIQHDTKFLGVILSSNLKWNKHIDIVRSKISKKYRYNFQGQVPFASRINT